MLDDINNTQKLRPLGSMSADEFFGGGDVPMQDLNRSKLEDIPDDVVELANRMIQEDANPQSRPVGGGQPQQPHQPQQTPLNVDLTKVNADGTLDIDLFQLAVGKDVVSNIDDIIKHHEASIEFLRKYKHKLCQLLNIKEDSDESK